MFVGPFKITGVSEQHLIDANLASESTWGKVLFSGLGYQSNKHDKNVYQK
jgi:hypothetical protein